ncbi:hypothetical protein HYH02_000662 [Chlamydomonas schloesseri]|uniref:Polycystin cation channel PKD1/PKD2 domain-containing protein n=1 Tax=Chlamydomonas schloesseri TaxID=2026947 RepID=A0A835WYX8_9CHLO|nr:hypothetical protein HYH02_000662 [Chlamydomonas schloesseri]|eukprot:KAG2454830.1 hypothetical protein HYH02_000662 [Chlamydomonas schloesseri]
MQAPDSGLSYEASYDEYDYELPPIEVEELDAEGGTAQPVDGAEADTAAPEITLQGAAQVTLQLYDTFLDEGATATDLRDGPLPVTASIVGPGGMAVREIATSAVTPTGQPFVVTYTARDAAGNVGQQQRLVVVADNCAEAGESRCPQTMSCSTFKSCDIKFTSPASDGGDAGTLPAASQKALTRPPDTTPPVLTLLGGGQPYTTRSGAAGLINNVFLGDAFADPGATATDEVPAAGSEASTTVDLTASVFTRIKSPASEDVTAVSTAEPTGGVLTGGVPYVLSYDVVDDAGNRAPTLYRRVYVLCRPPEFEVVACANRANVRSPMPYDMAGLQYCGIDTKKPGMYAVTFHLTWPAVGELMVTRTLVVEEDCSGERTCPDGTCSVDQACASELGLGSALGASSGAGSSSGSSSSSSGDDRATGVSGSSSNNNSGGGGASSSSSSTPATSSAVAANTPPQLTLAMGDVVGSQVSVKRGVAYARCAAGQVPTADRPCEPLGAATDGEDGDLTAKIALCPPDNCAKTQCRAHWADRKQPSECGVDTVTAAVGTTFRLQFVVYDSRGASATAERTITVVNPCGAGKFYCPLDAKASPASPSASNGGFVCSDVKCEERERLANLAAVGSSAAVAAPRLFLLPELNAGNLSKAEADQTVFLPYRQPASFSFAPCATFSETAACAVVANDTSTGEDLTPVITATVAPVCPSGRTCTSCSLAGFTAGLCLPGRYRVAYTAASASTGTGGASGSVLTATTTRSLDVRVEQMLSTRLSLDLYVNGSRNASTSRDAAESWAAQLMSSAATRAAVLNPVLQAFGINASNMRSMAVLESPSVVESVQQLQQTKAANTGTNVSSNVTLFLVRVSLNVTTGSSDFVEGMGMRPADEDDTAPPPAAGSNSSAKATGGSKIPSSGAKTASSSGKTQQQQRSMRYRLLLDYSSNATPAGGCGARAQDDCWAGHLQGGEHSASSISCWAAASRRISGVLDEVAAVLEAAATEAPAVNLSSQALSQQGCSVQQFTYTDTELAASGGGGACSDSSCRSGADGSSSAYRRRLSMSTGSGEAQEYYGDYYVGSSSSSSRGGSHAPPTPPDTAGLQLLGAEATVQAVGGHHRRFLQSSYCAGSSSATNSSNSNGTSTTSGTSGVAAVGSLVSTCSSPTVDAAGVALAALLGAVSDLDRLNQQMQEQQVAMLGTVSTLDDKFTARDEAYRSQLVAMAATASATFSNMSSKADTLLALVSRSLDAAGVESAALQATLGLMQAVLNQAQTSTDYANSVTAVVADAIAAGGSSSGNVTLSSTGASDDPDTMAYVNCMGLRGLPTGVQVAFTTNWRAAGAAPAAVTAATTTGSSSNTTANPTSSQSSGGVSARRRTLLASGVLAGGVQGDQQGPNQALDGMRFAGYDLPYGQDHDYSLWDVRVAERSRRAGNRNRVLIGLLLHQERRTAAEISGAAGPDGSVCGHSSFSHLIQACGNTSDAGAADADTARDLAPVGSDPVFNRVSVLHNARLNASDYYNMTPGSAEVNLAGLPHGFFHEPMSAEGFSAGYPVLLDTRLSARRAEQALQFIRDGGYLSATLTRTLRASLITYNADAAVFGTWRLDLRWVDSGVIEGTTRLLGLPAIRYGEAIKHVQVKRFTYDFLLICLIVGYFCMTCYDIAMQLRAQRWARALRQHRAEREAKRQDELHGGDQRQLLASGQTKRGLSRILRHTISAAGGRVAPEPAAAAAAAPELLGPAGLFQHFERQQVGTGAGATAGIDGAGNHDWVARAGSSGSAHRTGGGAVAEAWSDGGGYGRAPEGHNSEAEDQEEDMQAEGSFEILDKVGNLHLRKYAPRMGPKMVLYEAAICALMAAAVATYYTYTVRLSVREDFSARFDVYDADTFAPARYFLLRRAAGPTDAGLTATAVNATAAAGTLMSAANNSTAAPAGDAGRWRLAADATPLQQAAEMFSRVDSMYQTLVLYGFLQGLVLAMLVVRWLLYLSFQPRLSIISGTIVMALPDLCHLAIVVAVSAVMFAAAASIVFGPSQLSFSGLDSALYVMLKYVLLADEDPSFKDLLNSSIDKTWPEWALAGLLYVLGPIFFVLILLIFVLGMLAWPFGELKYGVEGQPGVAKDVARILGWYWQRLGHGAPKNKLIMRWIKAWLAAHEEQGLVRQLQMSVAQLANTVYQSVHRRQDDKGSHDEVEGREETADTLSSQGDGVLHHTASQRASGGARVGGLGTTRLRSALRTMSRAVRVAPGPDGDAMPAPKRLGHSGSSRGRAATPDTAVAARVLPPLRDPRLRAKQAVELGNTADVMAADLMPVAAAPHHEPSHQQHPFAADGAGTDRQGTGVLGGDSMLPALAGDSSSSSDSDGGDVAPFAGTLARDGRGSSSGRAGTRPAVASEGRRRATVDSGTMEFLKRLVPTTSLGRRNRVGASENASNTVGGEAPAVGASSPLARVGSLRVRIADSSLGAGVRALVGGLQALVQSASGQRPAGAPAANGTASPEEADRLADAVVANLASRFGQQQHSGASMGRQGLSARTGSRASVYPEPLNQARQVPSTTPAATSGGGGGGAAAAAKRGGLSTLADLPPLPGAGRAAAVAAKQAAAPVPLAPEPDKPAAGEGAAGGATPGTSGGATTWPSLRPHPVRVAPEPEVTSAFPSPLSAGSPYPQPTSPLFSPPLPSDGSIPVRPTRRRKKGTAQVVPSRSREMQAEQHVQQPEAPDSSGRMAARGGSRVLFNHNVVHPDRQEVSAGTRHSIEVVADTAAGPAASHRQRHARAASRTNVVHPEPLGVEPSERSIEAEASASARTTLEGDALAATTGNKRRVNGNAVHPQPAQEQHQHQGPQSPDSAAARRLPSEGDHSLAWIHGPAQQQQQRSAVRAHDVGSVMRQASEAMDVPVTASRAGGGGSQQQPQPGGHRSRRYITKPRLDDIVIDEQGDAEEAAELGRAAAGLRARPRSGGSRPASARSQQAQAQRSQGGPDQGDAPMSRRQPQPQPLFTPAGHSTAAATAAAGGAEGLRSSAQLQAGSKSLNARNSAAAAAPGEIVAEDWAIDEQTSGPRARGPVAEAQEAQGILPAAVRRQSSRAQPSRVRAIGPSTALALTAGNGAGGQDGGLLELALAVSAVDSMVGQLRGMLTQLLAAVREVQEMAALVAELLAAAQAASVLSDRRAVWSAVRLVLLRRLRELDGAWELVRDAVLEAPLPTAIAITTWQQWAAAGALAAASPASGAGEIQGCAKRPASADVHGSSSVMSGRLATHDRRVSASGGSRTAAGRRHSHTGGGEGSSLTQVPAASGGSEPLLSAHGPTHGESGAASLPLGAVAMLAAGLTRQRRGWGARRRAIANAEVRHRVAGSSSDGAALAAAQAVSADAHHRQSRSILSSQLDSAVLQQLQAQLSVQPSLDSRTAAALMPLLARSHRAGLDAAGAAAAGAFARAPPVGVRAGDLLATTQRHHSLRNLAAGGRSMIQRELSHIAAPRKQAAAGDDSTDTEEESRLQRTVGSARGSLPRAEDSKTQLAQQARPLSQRHRSPRSPPAPGHVAFMELLEAAPMPGQGLEAAMTVAPASMAVAALGAVVSASRVDSRAQFASYEQLAQLPGAMGDAGGTGEALGSADGEGVADTPTSLMAGALATLLQPLPDLHVASPAAALPSPAHLGATYGRSTRRRASAADGVWPAAASAAANANTSAPGTSASAGTEQCANGTSRSKAQLEQTVSMQAAVREAQVHARPQVGGDVPIPGADAQTAAPAAAPSAVPPPGTDSAGGSRPSSLPVSRRSSYVPIPRHQPAGSGASASNPGEEQQDLMIAVHAAAAAAAAAAGASAAEADSPIGSPTHVAAAASQTALLSSPNGRPTTFHHHNHRNGHQPHRLHASNHASFSGEQPQPQQHAAGSMAPAELVLGPSARRGSMTNVPTRPPLTPHERQLGSMAGSVSSSRRPTEDGDNGRLPAPLLPPALMAAVQAGAEATTSSRAVPAGALARTRSDASIARHPTHAGAGMTHGVAGGSSASMHNTSTGGDSGSSSSGGGGGAHTANKGGCVSSYGALHASPAVLSPPSRLTGPQVPVMQPPTISTAGADGGAATCSSDDLHRRGSGPGEPSTPRRGAALEQTSMLPQ